MDIKKAKEKLANTIRATNEEKIALKELVGTIQNESERLEGIKEQESSIIVEIDKGKEAIENQKKEIEGLNKEKGLVVTSLTATEKEMTEIEKETKQLQITKEETDKQLTKENDSKVKKIEKLEIKIAFLSDELRNKEDEYGNKINILTSKEIEIEDNIKDAEKRIKELVKEEKEAKEKTIVSINDIEIKEVGVKELKTEISDLEQDKGEKNKKIKEIEKETEEVEVKKEKVVKEFEIEQAKAGSLIQREKLVNLKAKEVKELYKGIGQDITI